MGFNSSVRAQFGDLRGAAVYIGDGLSLSSEKTLILNPLRPNSVRWNLLEHLSESSNLSLLAEVLVTLQGPRESHFFFKHARLLFEALAVSGMRNNQGISIPEIFDLLGRDYKCAVEYIEAAPVIPTKASTFLDLANSGSQNADTILNTLQDSLAYWATEEVRLVTESTSFKWADILSGSSSLEIVVSDEDETDAVFAKSAAICTLLTLERFALADPNGVLPIHIDVVVDQLGCPGEITDDWNQFLKELSAKNITIIFIGPREAGTAIVYRAGADRIESEILCSV